MKELNYNFRLVRTTATVLLVLLVIILFFLTMGFLVYFLRNCTQIVVFTILILSSALFLIFSFKYMDKLTVTRKASLILNEEYIIFKSQKYSWQEIDWYNPISQSRLGSGFSIGFIRGAPIRLVLAPDEIDKFIDLKKQFEQTLITKSINPRSYYNTFLWRLVGSALLLSNPALCLVMFVLDIEKETAVPTIVAWIFVSLPFPIAIFFNQERPLEK